MGKTAIVGGFRSNVCELEIIPKEIGILMWDYLDRLSPIPLSLARTKQREERATTEEESSCRGLEGTMMYMGNPVVTQDSMMK